MKLLCRFVDCSKNKQKDKVASKQTERIEKQTQFPEFIPFKGEKI
jgi:hypothetical protein